MLRLNDAVEAVQPVEAASPASDSFVVLPPLATKRSTTSNENVLRGIAAAQLPKETQMPVIEQMTVAVTISKKSTFGQQ